MKLFIKNMACMSCKTVVKTEINKLGLSCQYVDYGEAEIKEKITEKQQLALNSALKKSGLELLTDKRATLVEKIKVIISGLVLRSNQRQRTKFSSYLSNELGYDYTYLANLFSEVQGTTIENYMISQKIERVKELLVFEDFTLTEIADQLHYSSVAHLSNQFKKVTGLKASHFKQLKLQRRLYTESE